MAIVTSTGVTVRDLSEWLTYFKAEFRTEFGADLSLDPETPEGQEVGIFALAMTEADESIRAVYNASAVGTAADTQLDDLASLLHMARAAATRSSVTVTLTGVAGTTIPANSRARTADNHVFYLVEDTEIPAGGTVNATMRAVESGSPAQAAAGELNRIVTLVPGWETVTNAADATPGVAREADSAFRARYRASTARLANGPQDAIYAALTEAGTTAQVLYQNDGTAAGLIVGGADPSDLSALMAISDGYIRVQHYNYDNIDLTGQTTYAGIASVVQTKLRERIPGVLVTYQTNRFVVEFPLAGQFPLTAIIPWSQSGTDLAAPLKLNAHSGAHLHPSSIAINRFILPKNSVIAIVRGGTDAAIAAAIRQTKGLGVATYGGAATDSRRVSVTVGGNDTAFRRVNEIAIRITLALTVSASFPSNGLQEIKDNLVGYGLGTWRGGAGQFDTFGFQIGQPIDARRILSPINAVFGHEIESIAITDSDGNALPDTPAIDTLYTLAESDITITV